MHLTLHVWRQKSASLKGKMVRYAADDINPAMSFLEMLDVVNWQLIEEGEEPIAFDHDCREGICGSCGMMINGVAHGPRRATATCQLHMPHFKDGDTIYIEPWRSRAFPVLRDLIVDRGAFDRIIQSGGFISVSAGSAPEANSVLVTNKTRIERWMPRCALAAARASLLVPTKRLRYLLVRRFRIWRCSHRVNLSARVA